MCPWQLKHKKALLKGWPSLVVDEATIDSWTRKLAYPSTGLRLDNLIAIDVDVEDKAIQLRLEAAWAKAGVPGSLFARRGNPEALRAALQAYRPRIRQAHTGKWAATRWRSWPARPVSWAPSGRTRTSMSMCGQSNRRSTTTWPICRC